MSRTQTSMIVGAVAGVLAVTSLAVAAEVNVAALSQNGWFSDDTRADGLVSQPAGTNLVSPTLTDLPESLSGNPLHDADILAQIIFGVAPGTVPSMTHGGAVHLRIGGTAAGKSQISHRKDDASGHGPGSGFGPGFSATYSWMGNGTSSVTASLKFGIKTSEFGSAPVSPRTGENVWDKVLIFEPGEGNGVTSDGTWKSHSITHTSGKWWFFDRNVGGGTIATPMTLSDMSSSLATYPSSGAKTIKDVYDLITAPGALITSVQFGIGSGNANGSVYVNQFTSNVYSGGDLITFGTPSPYDQNVTPDIIFGAGNINGSFTVDRNSGVELGLRGKLRFPPSNIFKSNGDGTYTFNTGSGTGVFPNPEWNFEWSVNTDWNSTSGWTVGDLTYAMGLDFDPGAGTNFLVFDPITPGSVVPFIPPSPPLVFLDHAFGTNATGNGGGVQGLSGPAYAALLASQNVVQNSWRMTFYDEFPYSFDPDVPGRYNIYLAAFDGANEVARTEIVVLAIDGLTMSLEADPCQTDQDPITPGVQIAVELWLRNPDDVGVSGYQAFLSFNDAALTYVGASSSYSASPFTFHIQSIATANVSAGKLRLDGSLPPSFPPVTPYDGDALLATLIFTVAECTPSAVSFDLSVPALVSEFSVGGSPLATELLDVSGIVADDTAPVIGPVSDITQPADAGSCLGAIVTYTAPSVTDNCDPSPTLVCTPPSGSFFPVGTTMVTCIATDECGNSSSTTFDVTITATNAVDVVVELTGSNPTMRCIRFVMDDCSEIADVVLTFVGAGPSVAVATIEVPCGVWTQICAKDRQHTKWDTSAVTISGAKYVASSTLVLDPGDTDNDGDVDINDVTWLLAQFGLLANAGGCPWNGVRDADFSNNGAVGSEDYSLLASQWLTFTSCACIMPAIAERPDLQQRIRVRDALTKAADLNRDGFVDVLDVEVLEQRQGFSGTLSTRMRETLR